jgi:hypothetical protein
LGSRIRTIRSLVISPIREKISLRSLAISKASGYFLDVIRTRNFSYFLISTRNIMGRWLLPLVVTRKEDPGPTSILAFEIVFMSIPRINSLQILSLRLRLERGQHVRQSY